jgi:RNA polymerase sigma-70 factor (ECF subfamily)
VEDIHALMVQYGPALRRYFRKRAPPHEVDDLVQNVFLKMQVRGAGDTVENIERYLFRTAATVLVDGHRGDPLNLRHHQELHEDLEPVDEFSPERILIGAEGLDRIMAVLQALPPRTSEAFILHRFEEMSYGEIAAHMGLSVRSVESHIKRTLDRLLAQMGAAQ